MTKGPAQKRQSPKVIIKNLFRQHFNRGNRVLNYQGRNRNAFYWNEFQKVRQLATPSNINELYSVVEENPYYPFSGLGNSFVKNNNNFIDARLRKLTPLSLDRELTLQLGRINHYAPLLIDALQSIALVNQYIVGERWEDARAEIEAHKLRFGTSIVIMKKDFLCALELGSLSALSQKYKDLTSGYQGSAYALINRYLYDFIDPASDPTRASRYWVNVYSKRLDSDWWSRIIEDSLFPCPISKAHLASTLLRTNATSLIDLSFLVWRAYNLRKDWPEIDRAWITLDLRVRDALAANFSTLEIIVPKPYMLAGSHATDKEIYKLAFIFGEYASSFDWFAEIQTLAHSEHLEAIGFDFGWLAGRSLSSFIRRLKSNFIETFTQLEAANPFNMPLLKSQTDVNGQDFLFSLVVAGVLRGKEPFPEPALVLLLSRAIDLHNNISMKTLEDLKTVEPYANSPILRFLLSEVRYRKYRTGDDELERRLCFMEMFSSNDKGEILRFLTEAVVNNDRLAVQIARLCSRRFLEKLFLMMSSVKEVLEVRLSLCDWLITHDGKNADEYVDERNALSRELGNLDAQSDLDSTRIHVDEDALREWFVDAHQASATRYVQTVIAEGTILSNESLLSYYTRLKDQDELLTSSAIGSDIILLEIFESTLHAFASDKMFGLDSYLSRRIRHGTLRGHLITPLDRAYRLFEDALPANQGEAAEHAVTQVRECFGQWRTNFLSKVDYTRRNIIQIKSEKAPDGMIVATWRIVANVAHVDAMVGRVRSRVIESNGNYDIFADIYAVCWDCLEYDLASLRLYMTKDFLGEAQTSLVHAWDELSYEAQLLSRPLFGDMRDILKSRVREVSGWFIRPVFRQDSYSLKTLINTTFSTTKELDDSYKFDEAVEMPTDVTVNRGSFEVFWDVLFVLIGNAARHGSNAGRITVAANSSVRDTKLVELSVTSDMDPPSAKDHIERILTAFEVSESSVLDRASVEEGFSGLRKLIGLIRPRIQL